MASRVMSTWNYQLINDHGPKVLADIITAALAVVQLAHATILFLIRFRNNHIYLLGKLIYNTATVNRN